MDEFDFVGHLTGSANKAWRCSRCFALVVADEDARARHTAEHERVDAVEQALAKLAKGRKRVGTPAAQFANDTARERRIAGYRDALEAGRMWDEPAVSGAVLDAPAWRDSATVREVPPS